MGQRLLWWLILAVIIAWIVLTYLPSSLIALPTIAFTGAGGLLATLGVVALLAFLAIQFWLVRTTLKAVRGYRVDGNEPAPARPPLTAELLWTALPIAITLGVAWASFGMWSGLPAS